MARTGKIARLPEWIRDEVSRCLREGMKARKIVEWLNSHRDVQAVMDFKTLRAICSDVVALRRRAQEDGWMDLEQKQQSFN